jgi:hypothetical protein
VRLRNRGSPRGTDRGALERELRSMPTSMHAVLALWWCRDLASGVKEVS